MLVHEGTRLPAGTGLVNFAGSSAGPSASASRTRVVLKKNSNPVSSSKVRSCDRYQPYFRVVAGFGPLSFFAAAPFAAAAARSAS
jgi:hypothetical protein